ncbi:MAG: ABC-F family ATP-binding cassette domain-containing protein, partial [Desulfosalsimonas sp.]
MINIEGLSKSYGGTVLFDNISFRVNSGERVGLVGRNGHGKTTLFRIILGEESPDSGIVSCPKNYRIGHVSQSLEFSSPTVLEECMKGLPADSEGQHWQAEKILAGLGFSEQDMQRPPSEFSGGYQVRLNLAGVLVSRPDMLLLDEPTNYLDITSIRWIRRFLVNWPGELFVITHDRSFMDQVVTHIAGIHRRKVRKVPGSTEKYYSWIAQEEEVYEKTRQNDEKRRKDIEQFINRFRAKARLANLVQSRVKTLNKLTRKQRLEKAKTLDFSFNSIPFSGKYVLGAQNLSFSYDTKQAGSEPLISDFSISIGPRERICIVGRNGAGKTTLLRMLAGDLAPDSGRIENHPNSVRGLFEQTNIHTLSDERTVEEEVLSANPDIGRQGARSICGAMLFEGEQALKKIRVLSGGEKCRVMLGRLLARPVNFLLLDEPTNHFDMESADALLSAIDNFDGAVVMVTH